MIAYPSPELPEFNRQGPDVSWKKMSVQQVYQIRSGNSQNLANLNRARGRAYNPSLSSYHRHYRAL